MHIEPAHAAKLVNADGRGIITCGVATMTAALEQFPTSHKFVVVDHLSTPVVLGCDLLIKGAVHRYCLQCEAVQARMISQPVKSLM